MTDTDQIKAIAELDGKPNAGKWCGSPPYLTSRDAILSAIEKQPHNVQWATFFVVIGLTSADKPVFLSTAAQWSESLLRATNKWTTKP